jgi:hypothetical protein
VLTHREPKTLTRAALMGEEFRIARLYGASVLAEKILLAYAARVGRRYVLVAQALERQVASGLSGFQNVHGERCSATWYTRRKLTYGQKLVREAVAREERGENWMLLRRQAGG